MGDKTKKKKGDEGSLHYHGKARAGVLQVETLVVVT